MTIGKEKLGIGGLREKILKVFGEEKSKDREDLGEKLDRQKGKKKKKNIERTKRERKNKI